MSALLGFIALTVPEINRLSLMLKGPLVFKQVPH